MAVAGTHITSSIDAIEQIVAALGSPVIRPGTHPDPLSVLVAAADQQRHQQNQPGNEVPAVPLTFIGEARDLFFGLGHLAALKNTPAVIHVSVVDFGLIAALRSSGFVFLQSFGPEDAQDITIVAELLARKVKQPIVHFFSPEQHDAPLRWTPELIGAAIAQDDTSEASNSATSETTVEALSSAFAIAGQDYAPFEYRGNQKASKAVVVFGTTDDIAQAVALDGKIGLLTIRVLAPFSADKLLDALPTTVTDVVVLEQIAKPTAQLLPIFQDLFGADAEHLSKIVSLKSYRLGKLADEKEAQQVLNTAFEHEGRGELLGLELDDSASLPATLVTPEAVEQGQKTDNVYLNVMAQLFPKLVLLNRSENKENSTSPEFAFGKFLAAEEHRARVIQDVINDIKENKVTGDEANALSQWTVDPTNPSLLTKISEPLQREFGAQWIVGSDQWAYDLGMSGVHHVLASGKNVNMLVIESAENATAKKDIGLYAMNFGNVYTASVAVYASYTQLLQALLEAQAFNGPAVVVAYLPTGNDALDVLKRTKQAVESGFWPLYRYNGEDITLDSYVLKQSLREFLDRDQKLTMLASQQPQLARVLAQSQGSLVRSQQKEKAEAAYAQLLEGLSGPPVLVLFASDGGQAESVGKRLARRAKARGLKSRVGAFDDYELDDLVNEPHVIFVTSTAGQGEFPQNGRQLWEQLKNATVDFGNTKVAVFGMGDSEYWPRKQDKHYYNKPSKELWKRLEILGAQPLVEELGLGDDQDADGWSTGYNQWEPEIWKALGVDNVDGGDEPPPLTNEDMKRDSNYLRGTIAEELKDESTGAINAVNQQLTKFHGIYMQDDRDIREQRKKKGLEPAYAFMVRIRLPGCRANPDQWLTIDRLCDERGNGTFKITTRATFQLHGVIKEDLKPAIRGINSCLLDTVAACGDVDRNVVGSASVQSANVHREVAAIGKSLSEHLLPRTTAYYEIWLEGEDASDGSKYQETVNTRTDGPTKKPSKYLVSQSPPILSEGAEDEEPLYKQLYLPRKFKINIAVPPYNDVDVYGHDIGLISIIENNSVIGFNVCVGGGMGTTHNNRKTYPRTGSLIGYSPKEKILDVCEKIMLVQRDNGDRKNRKHARLKYTVDDMTVEGFKAEVEKYLGYQLEPAREHPAFKTNVDTYGWIRDEEGFNHFTTFVENGRVEDTPELKHRSGFREIAYLMKDTKQGEFRLTANQHIVVAGFTDEVKPKVDEILKKYKLDNIEFSGLRLSSAACVAFPTCGLAMAESERYLPVLITKLEAALEEYGLRHDSVVMRMTGCPNGCSRPWLAEVALVGKAYGAYNLMLGGGHIGQRLNKLYRSSLKEEEILDVLRPLFKSWALERQENEPFGDFVIRKGVIKATREGKDWWDDVEPGLE